MLVAMATGGGEEVRVAIAMGLIGRCCHSNREGGKDWLP